MPGSFEDFAQNMQCKQKWGLCSLGHALPTSPQSDTFTAGRRFDFEALGPIKAAPLAKETKEEGNARYCFLSPLVLLHWGQPFCIEYLM
jgi:hypothetical protein